MMLEIALFVLLLFIVVNLICTLTILYVLSEEFYEYDDEYYEDEYGEQ